MRQQRQQHKLRQQQQLLEHLHQQYQQQQQQQQQGGDHTELQDATSRDKVHYWGASASVGTGTGFGRGRPPSSILSRSPSPHRSPSLLRSSDWTAGASSAHRQGSDPSYVPSLASSLPLPPPPDPFSSSFIPPPPPMRATSTRQDALDVKARAPRHSISRVRLLCGWLTSLRLWHKPIEIENIRLELRSGVFLVRLVQFLDPSAVFVGVTQRVLNAKPAIANIEQVLGHVLRSKKIVTTRCVIIFVILRITILPCLTLPCPALPHTALPCLTLHFSALQSQDPDSPGDTRRALPQDSHLPLRALRSIRSACVGWVARDTDNGHATVVQWGARTVL